jgi:hypothetical protein
MMQSAAVGGAAAGAHTLLAWPCLALRWASRLPGGWVPTGVLAALLVLITFSALIR